MSSGTEYDTDRFSQQQHGESREQQIPQSHLASSQAFDYYPGGGVDPKQHQQQYNSIRNGIQLECNFNVKPFVNQLMENPAALTTAAYFNEVVRPMQMGGGALPKMDPCSLRDYLQTSTELVKNMNMRSTPSGVSMNTQ